MITEEQVSAVLKDGAATIDTPLTAAEVGAAREAVARLLPLREPGRGEKPRYRYQIGGFLDPSLLDILQHPFFEEVARRVLSAERVEFFQTAITATYPQPDAEWTYDQHVDIQYYLSDFHALPSRIICSFFLWLTDVNERRAPMMFRPGSHLLLGEENERRGAGPEEVRTVRPLPLSRLPALEYAAPIPLLARAGQVSVLTTAAVHGASLNVDDAPRRGIVVTFTAAGVEIGLPPDQAEEKRRYHAALFPLLRADRRHILEGI